MLEELGRLLTQAFMLNRREAERWAELIIGNQTGEAARQLVLAYIRGRQVGYTVHGATLGMPKRIPTAVARRWREAGLQWVADVQSRVEKTFNERGDITRAFVRSYAEGVTTQATWAGQDQMFKDLAAASTVEFKRWVRAWPRTDHRDWHDILEDAKAIPVDDLFTLPGGPNAGSQVYGPRDWNRVSDPAEHMNCGHALAFETAPTAENTEDPRGSVVYDPRDQPRTRAAARFSRPRAAGIPLERRADVWSPTKTPEAAEAFVQDSAYREPVYHVTSAENVDSLSSRGFDLDRTAFGRVYGDGAYLALDAEGARVYETSFRNAGTASTRLQLRANVARPFEYREAVAGAATRDRIVEAAGAKPRYDDLLRERHASNWRIVTEAPGANLGTVRAQPSTRPGVLTFSGPLPPDVVAARSQYFEAARAAGRYVPDPEASVFTRALQDAGFDSLIVRPAGAPGSDEYRNVGGPQLIVFDPRKVVIVRGGD